MVNNAPTAASPLSEERVREYEQEISSVESGHGFIDDVAYELAKIARALLADRTALTARLEAVARLTDEEETVIASLRWRVENYRRHMTESGAAGGDMRVSGDHLECLIEAIDRLVPAPNHPSPART